ncbi:MAG: GDP-mannose-dependent alpha-(1-6)-phosphatidylinositol monomannoside mannosyltransferase PimB, partial [Gammaproteobacteria bacterium]|nr:GDP-mannose-dependent alpha-(1-6)-phosphatidylinositol monomannoside mannosyltransferase PimB [Gammaproteobacteria bacterium]
MRRFNRPLDWQEAANIVISQDFLPKIGGAHSWLYETYKRWGSPVRVLTNRYSQLAEIAESERTFDREKHDSIEIFRTIMPSADLSLVSPACLKSYVLQLRSVHHLAERHRVILHCLRAFPDGFAGALYKQLRPRSATLV